MNAFERFYTHTNTHIYIIYIILLIILLIESDQHSGTYLSCSIKIYRIAFTGLSQE